MFGIDNVQVSMVLTTAPTQPIMVHLFSYQPSSKESSEVAVFSVSATDPVSYVIDPWLLSYAESGKQGCLVINSQSKFAVFVHMSDASGSAASLTLLPVNIWGRRYTVVTLTTRPFIVVFSAEPTNVKLRFKMDPPSTVRIDIDGDIFTDRSTLMFHLERSVLRGRAQCFIKQK
ncbi:hypothetical protein Btru_017594 [Bulinus truncatus]|nr:hypothetical protein Btru_017594 [Bulinus truncatus]